MKTDVKIIPFCGSCRKILSQVEIDEHVKAKMPALCSIHLPIMQERLKVCVPKLLKMNLF